MFFTRPCGHGPKSKRQHALVCHCHYLRTKLLNIKSCEAKLFSGFQGGLGAKELRANLIKELNQNGFKIQDQGVTNGLDLDVNTDL